MCPSSIMIITGFYRKGQSKSKFCRSSGTLRMSTIFLRCLPDGKVYAQLTTGADSHARQRTGILLPMKANEFRKYCTTSQEYSWLPNLHSPCCDQLLFSLGHWTFELAKLKQLGIESSLFYLKDFQMFIGNQYLIEPSQIPMFYSIENHL